jgi:hypothetical protein
MQPRLPINYSAYPNAQNQLPDNKTLPLPLVNQRCQVLPQLPFPVGHGEPRGLELREVERGVDGARG